MAGGNFNKGVKFTLRKRKEMLVEAFGHQGQGCQESVNSLINRMSAQPQHEPITTPDFFAEPKQEEMELDGG